VGGGKSYTESKGLRTEGAYEKSFVLSLKNISHIVLYDSLSLSGEPYSHKNKLRD